MVRDVGGLGPDRERGCDDKSYGGVGGLHQEVVRDESVLGGSV